VQVFITISIQHPKEEETFKPEVREAFRKAALEGVPQLIGIMYDRKGGYCAQGWLYHLGITVDTTSVIHGCHLCGATTQTHHNMGITSPGLLLIHLNNDHRLDWLGLAEKIPVTEE